MKTSTTKITIQFSAEAQAALKNFQARYPTRTRHDFINAAVCYLAKQGWAFGLNADCMPLNPTREQWRDTGARVVAEEMAGRHVHQDKKNHTRLILV